MSKALQFNIESRKFDRIFVFIFLEKKNFLENENDYKTTQIIFFGYNLHTEFEILGISSEIPSIWNSWNFG